MKYLNFSISETSGRTFEVPMDKVEMLVEQYRQEAFENTGVMPSVDLTNVYEIAQIVTDFYLDDVAEDEKNNGYYEITLDNANFTGED